MFRPALILTAVSAAVSSPAVATTIQQDFDAAQALIDAGEYPRARAAFTALLARFPAASAGRASSIVRARLGNMMLATGDPEAAEPLLTAAIAGFKGAMPQDAEERATAGYDLGRAQEARGALDTAARTYRTVLGSRAFPADGLADIGLRASLARTLIWSDPAEARRLLDALLALPPEKLGSAREQRALLETLRGRVELNNNNPAEARHWFTIAARSAGGAETQKISIADIRIRGDLALANQMLGRLDEVQKYVAYSGAGALVNEGLTAAVAMPLPACAPLTGLATDAVAVVEFAIGADGRVSGVTPIYASRGSGESAGAAQDDGPEILFPKAVSRWFWNTEDVTKLDPFWRRSVRVELRCFNSRPDADPVRSAFRGEIIAWLEGLGVRDDPDWPDNDAAALPLVRAELARREQGDGRQSAQLLPVLMALTNNSAAPNTERRAAAARWQALARQHKPPLPVLTLDRLSEINWEADPIASRAATLKFKRQKIADLLSELDAGGDGDSRAAMLVRLRLGETLEEMRDDAGARALFERVTASPDLVLPAGDPIRIAALLRVANLAVAARDTAAAASAFAATGLTAEQCSLIDVRPQGINNRISEKDFPLQSRLWGTGGFARVGYDITADGNTANVRTIVASPPFIFGPSTEKAITQFKFRPVFRPGNTIGCTGNAQYVRFTVLQSR